MAHTVADHIVSRLHAWGVRASTAIPATASTASWARSIARRRQIEFIQARHEEMAAFMACAHAKFTGEVGVCLATSGPGAIHLLNGLYDAQAGSPAGRRDRRPAGARARSAATTSRRSTSSSLFKDVAHEYVHMATRARADPAPGRPRGAHRARRAHRDLHHRPERPAGAGRRRGAAARARHGALRHRLRAPRVVPDDDDLARGRRHAQRGQEGRDARRRRRAACDRRGARGRRQARRGHREGAARQGRACPTICRSSPARSACSAREPSWRDDAATATRC